MNAADFWHPVIYSCGLLEDDTAADHALPERFETGRLHRCSSSAAGLARAVRAPARGFPMTRSPQSCSRPSTSIWLASAALLSAHAAALLCSTALAAEFTPIRVTLLSGGLAEISAVVPVSGRTLVTFDAPLAQIDDVLKSLVVTGEGVSVVSADLAGREPLSDTFMALPLEPSDLENSLTLLSALKGVPVEAERLDRSVRGAVIGVHTVQNETQGTATRC